MKIEINVAPAELTEPMWMSVPTYEARFAGMPIREVRITGISCSVVDAFAARDYIKVFLSQIGFEVSGQLADLTLPDESIVVFSVGLGTSSIHESPGFASLGYTPVEFLDKIGMLVTIFRLLEDSAPLPTRLADATASVGVQPRSAYASFGRARFVSDRGLPDVLERSILASALRPPIPEREEEFRRLSSQINNMEPSLPVNRRQPTTNVACSVSCSVCGNLFATEMLCKADEAFCPKCQDELSKDQEA